MGYYEKMDQIYDHFLKILASYLLRFHQIACLPESKGEGSKNFLPEPDSSKTFWQLGCQVATLFAPLPWPYLWTGFETRDTYELTMTQG